MSKERFEIFGDKLVKDNEQEPNLLNNYLCSVRLNDFVNKISDLEAKLAESEEKCKKAYQEGLLQKQFDKDIEIEQLEQQLAKIKEDYEQLDLSTGYYISDLKEELAEKEKEIEKLKQSVKAIDTYNQYSNDAKNLIILNPDNCYTNGHQVVIKTNDQDKIDYAVEQLEKVKEKLEERIELIKENEREGLYDRIQGLDMWQENKSAIKIINQLITEIKDGK